MSLRLLYFIAVFAVAYVNGETRVAVAHLVSQRANGSIIFTETAEGLKVDGVITGLSAGAYGFHVHEFGDTSDCYQTGRHFNPDNTLHGDRVHQVRHVGDLGNVVFVDNGVSIANFSYVDRMMTLRGRNSILGRTLVLHEGEDDLGQGNNEASLQNGNAGARVACGVIGIRYPADPWNAAGSIAPSVLMSLVAAVFVFSSI